MFLNLIRRRNPALIEQAIALHQAGKLPANCYVVDLDAVQANAGQIAALAASLGLKTFAMTKQMGRNGAFCRAVAAGGITKAVAVDMACARATQRAAMGLGHVGHLVQVPRFEAGAAAALKPDYWTVFGLEKAAEAGAAVQALGRSQAILARLHGAGDRFYRGHEGGFAASDVLAAADAIDALPGARFAGVTSFPAQLFDPASGKVLATPNLATLGRAAEALARAGRSAIEINAPGTTSATTLRMLAAAGATQIEPGHALTGTTPLHALQDLPEQPAVVYLSEVSHRIHGEAFCFGGGLYLDPVFPAYPVQAIVAREPTTAAAALVAVELPAPDAIDYYAMLQPGPLGAPRVGDSVVFGFRPQAFVTRAHVAGVRGLACGQPVLEALSDACGRPVGWPL